MRVIIEVKELQEVEGGDVQRKTSLVDIIISVIELGDLLLSAGAYFSPTQSFAVYVLICCQSPFLCRIQSTCCPRNLLFVERNLRA